MVTRTMETVSILVNNGNTIVCTQKDYNTTVAVLAAQGLEIQSTERGIHKYAMTDAAFLMNSKCIDKEDNE